MYYGNQECEIIAELDGNEAVIELCIGEIGESEDDIYPYEARIIVSRKYLTETSFDQATNIKTCKQLIDEANREVNQVKLQANKEIREEKVRIETEIKQLKQRASAFKGLSGYVDFLEGKYTHVVYSGEYIWGIKKLDEIMCSCDKNELAAVSFRSDRISRDRKDFDGWLYLSTYSDDSGASRERVKGFASYEEAKMFFGDLISTGKIKAHNVHVMTRLLDECDKHEITNDKIEEYRKQKVEQIEAEKQKIIAKLKSEIEELLGSDK